MGCTSSSTKEATGQKVTANELPDDARVFMRLVNEDKHPVARHILQEWAIFVKKEEEVNANKSNAAVHHAVGIDGGEVWANTTQNPVTHKSVDEVGQSFLHYLRNDLCQRHWGGNFNYSVAGVTTQGFIVVTAEVDVAQQPPRGMSTFKLQLNYNTPGFS